MQSSNHVANPPEDSSSGAKEESSNVAAKEPENGPMVVRRLFTRTNKVRDSQDIGDDFDPTTEGGLENNLDPFPPVDTVESCGKAASRLRDLALHLQHGDVPVSVLQKTLQYAAGVLDAMAMDESRKLVDDDDDLSEVQPDAVPNEVREWLASTFTRQQPVAKRKSDEIPKFRSVAHAIRAGIMVDRIYRRMCTSILAQIPSQIVPLLKSMDEWSFDVFAVNDAAPGQVLRYITYDLLNRYGLIHKFKISTPVLESFLMAIESGYQKHKNPYHNNLHAADVTQTVHFFLCQAGLANWLTDLEIFATIIAAVIHDYEHTGTTNNFHVMSGSDISLLYNDRAVLENFHVSTAFRIIKQDEHNILSHLSKEEYREFRSLVIEMVLATDMSSHFHQLKTMKNSLTQHDFHLDKPKALSLVLHCADISHPGKLWDLHTRWTFSLMEEFFLQGDREKDLGLAYSPLCDRKGTLIAESQIGFIDFIVAPSMEVCGDLLTKMQAELQRPTTGSTLKDSSKDSISEEGDPETSPPPLKGPLQNLRNSESPTSRSTSSGSQDSQDKSQSKSPPSPSKLQRQASVRITPKSEVSVRPWLSCLAKNREQWQEKALQDAEVRAKAQAEQEKKDKEEALAATGLTESSEVPEAHEDDCEIKEVSTDLPVETNGSETESTN